MIKQIKVIGFDADDTLWVNEPYYRETEQLFCELLTAYKPAVDIQKALYNIEVNNLELYGYGSKAFMLSLIETALEVSDGTAAVDIIGKILELGKAQINRKNDLLPGVPEVLSALSEHYRLIVATKGDLLDQERKLRNSGLSNFFHHIEIMSDKKEENYQRLLRHLDIQPHEFLMIGNSVKSDVLPVISLGGYAIHVPFHVTWQHEEVLPHEMADAHYLTVNGLEEVLTVLGLPSVYCRRF